MLAGDNMFDGVSPDEVGSRPRRCLEAVQQREVPSLADTILAGAGREDRMCVGGLPESTATAAALQLGKA